MRISEFAKRLGVSTTTVRRLSRGGIIRSRRDRNGWRVFDEELLKAATEVLYPEDDSDALLEKGREPK